MTTSYQQRLTFIVLHHHGNWFVIDKCRSWDWKFSAPTLLSRRDLLLASFEIGRYGRNQHECLSGISTATPLGNHNRLASDERAHSRDRSLGPFVGLRCTTPQTHLLTLVVTQLIRYQTQRHDATGESVLSNQCIHLPAHALNHCRD